MSKAGNSECRDLLVEKLLALSANQRDTFDLDIERITRANAAKGTLRSGGTIKEVARSLKSILHLRANAILAGIKDLPFTYTDGLRSELDNLIGEFLPIDFVNFRERFLEVIHLTGANQRAESAGLELVEKDCHLVRNTLKSDLDQYLLILKGESATNSHGMGFLIVEAVGVIFTVFLAGMWAVNPSGNYEPWIIIIAGFIGVVELVRRHKSKPDNL